MDTTLITQCIDGELCDVREHINRQKYPERYTLVNSFINQRLNESVSHDSNNEKSRPLCL
jgi:hypothetical protein